MVLITRCSLLRRDASLSSTSRAVFAVLVNPWNYPAAMGATRKMCHQRSPQVADHHQARVRDATDHLLALMPPPPGAGFKKKKPGVPKDWSMSCRPRKSAKLDRSHADMIRVWGISLPARRNVASASWLHSAAIRFSKPAMETWRKCTADGVRGCGHSIRRFRPPMLAKMRNLGEA